MVFSEERQSAGQGSRMTQKYISSTSHPLHLMKYSRGLTHPLQHPARVAESLLWLSPNCSAP